MKKNRAKIRHHRRVQVRFCQEGGDEPRFGYVTNVSATGMFIETGKPFSKGDALDLEISVADELVRLKVRVVRSLVMPAALRSVKASGMGLEFAEPGEQLARLLQLLQLDAAPTGLPDVGGPRRLTRSAEISALKSFSSMQKIQVDPDRTSVDDPLQDRLRRAEQANLRLSRVLEKERRRRIGADDGAKATAAETGELRPELERLRKELEEAREGARANRVNFAERLETSRQASGALKQRVQRLTTQVEELSSERDRLRKKVERRGAAGVGEITITQPPLAVAPRQEGSFSKVLYLGVGLLLGAAGMALWLGAVSGVDWGWPGGPRSDLGARSSGAQTMSVGDPPARIARGSSGVADEPADEPDLALVVARVESWAEAWSEQRVDDYLASYSQRFVPPSDMLRAEWESERRERLLRPKRIHVTFGPIALEQIGPRSVRATFLQGYETDTYSDEVNKMLELVWQEGDWLIMAERPD